MKIFTLDELVKAKPVAVPSDDRPYSGRSYGGKAGVGWRGGRGPDKKKRKRKGLGQIGVENPDYHPIPWAGKPKGSVSDWGMGSRASREEDRKHWKSDESNWEKGFTENDKANIKLIDKMVSESPQLQKAVEGPIKWVGEKGFDECVAHLSGKKDITNPESLCGWLKGQARKKGELNPAHMGRIEKKEYLAKKKKAK